MNEVTAFERAPRRRRPVHSSCQQKLKQQNRRGVQMLILFSLLGFIAVLGLFAAANFEERKLLPVQQHIEQHPTDLDNGTATNFEH
ncbi:MAG: hypothetical protein LBB58_05880 [Cellulomonadaceae bacterium]|jgi:hypothetical protein|nr:hypothetical protein [Cellulomonadaceae bacterium]